MHIPILKAIDWLVIRWELNYEAQKLMANAIKVLTLNDTEQELGLIFVGHLLFRIISTHTKSSRADRRGSETHEYVLPSSPWTRQQRVQYFINNKVRKIAWVTNQEQFKILNRKLVKLNREISTSRPPPPKLNRFCFSRRTLYGAPK